VSDLIGWQREGHWTTQGVALVPPTPMVWRHHTWQISAVQCQLLIRDSGYALQREAIGGGQFRHQLITVAAPMAWNALPVALRHLQTVNSFKAALKTFLLSHNL